MSRIAELRCRCGEVRGRVIDASPGTVNRMVCYCDDCQAFVHHLGRADLLDEHGGTDIVQIAPSSLSFQRGTDRIAGVRLGPKGLSRWHSTCCQTPLGNTMGPAVPFVGIVARGFEGADAVFGPPVGAILGKFAIGTPPQGSDKLNLRLIGRAARLVLGWRLSGKASPHPYFFEATGSPRYPLTTLAPAERESLRRLCGPR